MIHYHSLSDGTIFTHQCCDHGDERQDYFPDTKMNKYTKVHQYSIGLKFKGPSGFSYGVYSIVPTDRVKSHSCAANPLHGATKTLKSWRKLLHKYFKENWKKLVLIDSVNQNEVPLETLENIK